MGFKDTARIIRLDDHGRILIFRHKDIGARANPDLSKWIKLADLSAVNENDGKHATLWLTLCNLTYKPGHYGHPSDRSSPLPPSSPPSESSSEPEESAAAAGPSHARHRSTELQGAPVQPAVVAGPSHVSATRPSTEPQEAPVQPAAIAGPSQISLASASKRKATVDAQPAITKKQKLQQYGNSKEKPLEVASSDDYSDSSAVVVL